VSEFAVKPQFSGNPRSFFGQAHARQVVRVSEASANITVSGRATLHNAENCAEFSALKTIQHHLFNVAGKIVHTARQFFARW
jgi:hypothetical protein